jgi:hypothetical protein
MNDEQNYQIYTPGRSYIKGWYTVEELELVLETMRRINRVSEEIIKESNNE